VYLLYIHRLFVYGTLLPGLDNYNRFLKPCDPKSFKARARGVMYYLPDDNYPVVVDGEGVVKGTLYEADDLSLALTQIDEIQKYTGVESQSHLIREIRDVENLDTGEIVKAHMYLWPPSKAQWLRKHAAIIHTGDWLGFLRNKSQTP
jgi:gamma-glutamylcyclotransferase (GGCT)/AIG2-like uncharacterized protein YtfP